MSYTTKSRMAMLEFIKQTSNKSITVNEIMEYLEKKGIPTNITTVYRYLDKLTKDGVVMKNSLYNSTVSAYRYAQNNDCHKHLHIQCSECGKVVHIDCCFMADIERHIFSHHNFSLDCNKSMLYGLCEVCRKKKEEQNEN